MYDETGSIEESRDAYYADSTPRSIVVTGNIIDGLNFYGPFANATDADDWATINLRTIDWHVVTLHHPTEV